MNNQTGAQFSKWCGQHCYLIRRLFLM